MQPRACAVFDEFCQQPVQLGVVKFPLPPALSPLDSSSIRLRHWSPRPHRCSNPPPRLCPFSPVESSSFFAFQKRTSAGIDTRHSAPARQCARAQPHRCSSRRPHAAPTTPRLTSARPRHPIWALAKHEPDVSAAWQPTARRCRRVSSLASRPTLPMTTQVPRTAARRPPWPEAWTLSNAIGGPVSRNTEQTARVSRRPTHK